MTYPDGVIQFVINTRAEMSEFASWEPERIKAFFDGVAQVLEARNGVRAADSQTAGDA